MGNTINVSKRRTRPFLLLALLFTLLSVWVAPAGAGDVSLDYLLNLSSFNGPMVSNWVSFNVDPERKELYVINSSDQTVSVFNHSGMLVYSFGDEGDFGNVNGLALDDDGSMFVLSGSGPRYRVLIADFRGELKGDLPLQGLPPQFVEKFAPNRIFCRNGRLYLVDTANFKVLVTDTHGKYLSSLDFAPIISVNFKKIDDFTIVGFTIDREGNYLFTLPVLAQVCILSPEGIPVFFGRRGSSPGKFNIIGGIAADDKGNIFIADTLRCVIMVFGRDKDFTFKGQFGYRGFGPGELIAPREIAVIDDFLYVSQSANRGVSVFRINVH